MEPSGNMFNCIYDGCDATRTSHQAMKDHVESVHLKSKKYSCDECDYKCALKQCLISHMRGIHGKGRPMLECPYEGCDIKRLSKSAIQLHVDSVHLKIKKHFCHLCEYKSCDSNSLNIHLRGVHNFGGKYECSFPDCKTKCVTKAALQNHVNNKHLKLHSYHSCTQCDFTTYSIREYRRHDCTGVKNLSDGEKPLPNNLSKSKRGRKAKAAAAAAAATAVANGQHQLQLQAAQSPIVQLPQQPHQILQQQLVHQQILQTVNVTPIQAPIQAMTIKSEMPVFPHHVTQVNPPS